MMIRLIRRTLFLAALAALWCCSGHSEPEMPARQMSLAATGTGMPEGSAARLIFWEQQSLDRIASGATPWWDCTIPKEELDNYATTKYNTGKSYPANNEPVYAAGFVPASLEPRTPGSCYEFGMPRCDGKDSTVLVSDGIVGSNLSSFSSVMRFAPATVRIIIKAKRDPKTMDQEGYYIYVKNVRVTFEEVHTPNLLRWSGQEYEAVHDAGVRAEPASVYDEQHKNLWPYDWTTIGAAYIAPQETHLLQLKSVTAWYSEGDPSFATYTEKSWSREAGDHMEIELFDRQGNRPVRICPGQSYEIEITFSQTLFEIRVSEDDWFYGGSLPVPIIPPNENSQTVVQTK